MWRLEVPNLKVEQYRDTTGPTVKGVKGMMVMASCIKNQKKALRDTAIIRLLYDLALRRGEVVSLDFCHLDLENYRVAVIGKGRTQREWLSMPVPTLKAIMEWIEVRGDENGPLFISLDRARKGDGRLTGKSVYHIVNKLGKQIGISTRPHGLRHTAITEAVKKSQGLGLGLEEVMDFSRHKSVEVLMVYRDRERNVQGQLANMVADSL
jgi:integrase/recombinase XerC